MGRPQASLIGLPHGWVDLSLESKLDGIEITHLRAQPCENEYSYGSSFCISLLKGNAEIENLKESGRWCHEALMKGALSFLPAYASGRTKFLGNTEAVNLSVNLSWLHEEDIRNLPLPSERIGNFRDNTLASIIDDIDRDNINGSPFGSTYPEALILSAIYRFVALQARSPLLPRQYRSDLAIDRARDYIHENLSFDLTLTSIASAASWNAGLGSFIRAFKAYSGQTPHAYILEARLERALVLLNTSKNTVSEIAFSCGFSSLSHFSTLFKQRFGIPPKRWRQEQTAQQSQPNVRHRTR